MTGLCHGSARVSKQHGLQKLTGATDPCRESERPRFIALSSIAGFVELMPKFNIIAHGAYSSTKAMLNSILRTMQLENDWLTVLSVHPG